jgi:hypothetical protein
LDEKGSPDSAMISGDHADLLLALDGTKPRSEKRPQAQRRFPLHLGYAHGQYASMAGRLGGQFQEQFQNQWLTGRFYNVELPSLNFVDRLFSLRKQLRSGPV